MTAQEYISIGHSRPNVPRRLFPIDGTKQDCTDGFIPVSKCGDNPGHRVSVDDRYLTVQLGCTGEPLAQIRVAYQLDGVHIEVKGGWPEVLRKLQVKAAKQKSAPSARAVGKKGVLKAASRSRARKTVKA